MLPLLHVQRVWLIPLWLLEALEEEGQRQGYEIKVETRGSVGAKNQLTADEIAAADLVIIAADIEVDLSRFAGKNSIKPALELHLRKQKKSLLRLLQQQRHINKMQLIQQLKLKKRKQVLINT